MKILNKCAWVFETVALSLLFWVVLFYSQLHTGTFRIAMAVALVCLVARFVLKYVCNYSPRTNNNLLP